MTSRASILDRLYGALVRSYPRCFRDEFGAEMRAVFSEAAAAAAAQGWPSLVGLFLRELRDLPIALWHAHVESWLEGGKMPAQNERITPSTRWEAFVGTVPFLAFGAAVMIGEVGHLRTVRGHDAEMVVYLLALTGLLVGWIRGFPLWSYSYLGWSFVLAWFNTNISVHGVDWGYRVWVPFGVTVVIALVWTRSLAPIRKSLRDIWNDWTRLSLAMFVLGSWLFLISDENHHPHLLLFTLASTLVVSAGSWSFLRSASLRGRVLSIGGGFIGAALICGICYATWDWQAYYGLPRSENWFENLGLSPIGVLFWLLILFWPVTISIIRRTIQERRLT
jgi:hypothetical protein